MTLSNLCGLLLLAIFLNCQNVDKEKFPETNDIPKYFDREYIEISLLFEIDFENEHFNMEIPDAFEVDDENNIYILDYYGYKIHKFSANGNYLTSLGSSGENPIQLMQPSSLAIKNDKLFIYEIFSGVKIWDLDGGYLDFKSLKKSVNIAYFLPVDNGILGAYTTVADRYATDYIWEWSYNDSDLREISVITKRTLPKTLLFTFYYNWAVNSENILFIPRERDSYLIDSYDIKTGKLINSFGRNWVRKEYSDKMREWYGTTYKRQLMSGERPPLREYPGVIRSLYSDGFDNLWVLLGEVTEDYRWKVKVRNTVDIFDKNGEFIYTFESDLFDSRTFMKNNLLITRDVPDKKVKVFQIKYNIK